MLVTARLVSTPRFLQGVKVHIDAPEIHGDDD